jgi:translation initiation factor 2 beta subunit (eIF-2beta)/eIF-5
MEKLEHIYDINELVDKFYDKINEMTAENNKSRGVKRADIMSKDRKTFINNFNDVCISIDRKPETVSAYIAKDLK